MRYELPATPDRAIWDIWLSMYRLPAMAVAHELGIFASLASAPATAAEIAQRLGFNRRATDVLLSMLSALGLGQTHPFAPTLNEWRVYYRFLLGRPAPQGPERAFDSRRKLEYVAALAEHDGDYPAHLARGVLLYQAGAPAEAAVALRRHLDQMPDGPWALRARNHLAACGALLIE